MLNLKKLQVDRDRLGNVSATAVARATIKAMDSIQNEPADIQIMALACLNLQLSRLTGIRPVELCQFAANVMERSGNKNFLGLAEYLKDDLGNHLV